MANVEDGIHVFGVSPHMHSAGAASLIEVVDSDNQVVEHLYASEFWDANWQGMHLRGNDRGFFVTSDTRIRSHCYYNTMDRNTTTRFGEGFTDEMCTPYIFYWPRMSMSTCITDHQGLFSYCNGNSPVGVNPIGSIEPKPEDPNHCNV